MVLEASFTQPKGSRRIQSMIMIDIDTIRIGNFVIPEKDFSCFFNHHELGVSCRKVTY